MTDKEKFNALPGIKTPWAYYSLKHADKRQVQMFEPTDKVQVGICNLPAATIPPDTYMLVTDIYLTNCFNATSEKSAELCFAGLAELNRIMSGEFSFDDFHNAPISLFATAESYGRVQLPTPKLLSPGDKLSFGINLPYTEKDNWLRIDIFGTQCIAATNQPLTTI